MTPQLCVLFSFSILIAMSKSQQQMFSHLIIKTLGRLSASAQKGPCPPWLSNQRHFPSVPVLTLEAMYNSQDVQNFPDICFLLSVTFLLGQNQESQDVIEASCKLIEFYSCKIRVVCLIILGENLSCQMFANRPSRLVPSGYLSL